MRIYTVARNRFIYIWHGIPEKKWLLLLASVIFISSIQIYWISTPFQDDYGVYYLWNKGDFSIQGRFGFAYINVLLTWIASKVDIHLARSMMLVGVLIPGVLLLFRLLRKLGYPLPVALFASGLTAFAPGQVEIPMFINGSYHAEALLVMLVSLWGGIRFLEYQKGYGWGWYLFAIVFYCWALRVGELVVPASAAFVFSILCWRSGQRRTWVLSGSLAVLMLYHTCFNIILRGRPAVQQAKPLTILSVSNIFKQFAGWGFPSIYIADIDIYKWALSLMLLSSICIGMGITCGRVPETGPAADERKRFGPRGEYMWRVAFPVLLCLSTLLVMAAAPWFRPRHIIFPAFGLYLFLSFTFYEAFRRLKYGKAIAVAILISLAAGSMLQHYKNIHDLYSPVNRMHRDFLRLAGAREYPAGAQIVLANMNPQTFGFWRWSTGYLQYALRRNDISGVIGNELMMVDPFSPADFKEGGTNGLSPLKPLFLYRYAGNGFAQLDYFLQWKDNSRDGNFTLYRTDTVSGQISRVMDGKGLASYEGAVEALSRQGVRRSDIMWGGEPSIADKKRLGYSVLSPNGGNGFFVSAGGLEIGGMGYVLSSEPDKTAVALKKTERPFLNILTIKGRLKTALPSGTRNGMIVFGEGSKELCNAIVFIGGESLAVQGPFVEKMQNPLKLENPGGVIDVELTVNIKEGTLLWRVDGNEIKSRLIHRPASINYIGYSVWNTRTEFSELSISGS